MMRGWLSEAPLLKAQSFGAFRRSMTLEVKVQRCGSGDNGRYFSCDPDPWLDVRIRCRDALLRASLT